VVSADLPTCPSQFLLAPFWHHTSITSLPCGEPACKMHRTLVTSFINQQLVVFQAMATTEADPQNPQNLPEFWALEHVKAHHSIHVQILCIPYGLRLRDCHSCSIITGIDGICPAAELMDLREKFAEDKRRIAELKASRKFKPV